MKNKKKSCSQSSNEKEFIIIEDSDVESGLEIVKRDLLMQELKKEYFLTNTPSKKRVQVVHAIFQRPDGKLLIVQRAVNKKDNPGLWDKTVGGHFTTKDKTASMCLIRETAEEIGLPVTISSNHKEYVDSINEFKTTKKTHKAFAFLFEFRPNSFSVRQESAVTSTGEKAYITWPKRQEEYFYLGMTDCELRFKDGEASKIIEISLPDLERKINENPLLFTYELREMILRYGNFLLNNKIDILAP